LQKGVRTIAKFLGKEISDENVAKICDHCSVQNMKTNDKVNLSYWRDVKNVNDEAGGGFINKGQHGFYLFPHSDIQSKKMKKCQYELIIYHHQQMFKDMICSSLSKIF
jgi:hypothetical protein